MRLVMKKGIPLSKGRENAIPLPKGTVSPHTVNRLNEMKRLAEIPCGGCGHTLPLHEIPLDVRPTYCPFCGEMGDD